MTKELNCQSCGHETPCRLPCKGCAEDCPPQKFYDCGICGHYHAVTFDGDCRDDSNRFAGAELDERLGASGWIEVDMPETGEPRVGKGFFKSSFRDMEKINFSGAADPTEYVRKLRED